MAPDIRYCGDFYGQTGEGAPLPDNVTVDAFAGIVDRLDAGWTELGCHPGTSGPRDSDYARERLDELGTLTDPEVRRLLDARGIRLASFHDFRDRPRSSARAGQRASA